MLHAKLRKNGWDDSDETLLELLKRKDKELEFNNGYLEREKTSQEEM
jgi:hypothetical protein